MDRCELGRGRIFGQRMPVDLAGNRGRGIGHNQPHIISCLGFLQDNTTLFKRQHLLQKRSSYNRSLALTNYVAPGRISANTETAKQVGDLVLAMDDGKCATGVCSVVEGVFTDFYGF